ncbi:GAF domain-containing protein [Dactylosporangium sp. CS-047395]|uniref:GAF domain-containing protein n=1 Tax=Dactylosporangium sp. CS-047395 TaxID=3239936 RepID=UPI003D92D9C9
MTSSAPDPADSWRLAPAREVLTNYDRLDHAGLAALARHTAEILGAPVSAINVIVGGTAVQIATHGLGDTPADLAGVPTDWLPCHTVITGNAPTRIDDLRTHPSGDGPLLRGGPLRSYAGVPLALPLGRSIGTLCVLHEFVGAFSATDLRVLASLARDATGLLQGPAPA